MPQNIDTRYLLCAKCLSIALNPFHFPSGTRANAVLIQNNAVACCCGALLAAPNLYVSHGQVWVSSPGNAASVMFRKLLDAAKAATLPDADLGGVARDVRGIVPAPIRELTAAYFEGLDAYARTEDCGKFLTVLFALLVVLLTAWATGTSVSLQTPGGAAISVEGESSQPDEAHLRAFRAQLDAFATLVEHLEQCISDLGKREKAANHEELARINDQTQQLLRRMHGRE